MSTVKPTLPKPPHKETKLERTARRRRPKGLTPAGEDRALHRVQRWVQSHPDRSPFQAPGHIQEKMALVGRSGGKS